MVSLSTSVSEEEGERVYLGILKLGFIEVMEREYERGLRRIRGNHIHTNPDIFLLPSVFLFLTFIYSFIL